MNSRFIEQLEDIGITLNSKKEQEFEAYWSMLQKWNNKINLTRIVDREDVYEKHFLDSLSVVKALPIKEGQKIIDIGTGAGLPGMPIKIVFPDTEVLLVDSLEKRVDFLNRAIRELELKNIRVIHGRAEQLAKEGEYRESYDLAVSRAVANLSTLSEYNMPFLKTGGHFVAYKGSNISDELEKGKNAIDILGGKIKLVKEFKLPLTNINRTIVVIGKTSKTPEKYPRRAGIPEKRPL